MGVQFSEQQRSVVENRGGNLLVSAAAGSGKTTVLVERIMKYLTDPADPANLDEFLIITYTKAAAGDLRRKIGARLSTLIAEQPRNLHLRRQVQRLYMASISTVHSFCSELLRQYPYQTDVPMDFRVADENECRQLREDVMAKVLEEAYARADENPDFCAFVDTQGIGRNDATVPEIVLKIYDASRCHPDPEAWLEQCLRDSLPASSGDLAELPWGRFLMDIMQEYLALQIPALERCVEAADRVPEFRKAADVLMEELQQIRVLQDSKTWEEYVRNCKISFGTLRFPTKNPAPEVSEQIKAVRDACKKNLAGYVQFFSESSEQILSDASQLASAARGLIGLVRAFSKAFAKAKAGRRVLDFGDLEHKTLDLLMGKARSGPTAAAREIGSRYREIMVDEYQDSNGVQDGIFRALSRDKHNCFMVGDVKQSIYRFRLADPGIFLEKYHTYVPAEQAKPGESRKISLSRNYRSGNGVIRAVNDVFSLCMSESVGGLHYGPEEQLVEGVPHGSLPDPEIEFYAVEAGDNTYARESAFTAGRIRELLDGTHMVRQGEDLRPITASDIVILLRSPGTNGLYFQNALEELGIPCRSDTGSDLLKTEEIETLRALLCVISNPRQDIPLTAVLSSPIFGFMADELAQVRKGKKSIPFYEALRLSELPKATEVCGLLDVFREKARSETISGLLAYLYASLSLEGIYGIRQDGSQKKKNLQSFFQIAVDYENGGRRDLDMFLHYLDSMAEKGLQVSGDDAAGDFVTIQSIHKSKGLEYPVVFLCGLAKTINQESSRGRALCDRELGIGLSVADRENRLFYPSAARRAISVKERRESLSEEMRVLYVAMTRARDRLIMTYTRKDLPKHLTAVGNRLALEDPELMASCVSCMGDWILMAAMRRTEAGELFAAGAKHHETTMGEPAWKIRLVDEAPQEARILEKGSEERTMPPEIPEQIRRGLAFRYPHQAAVVEPSKQTATQQKGRQKDEEAARNSGGSLTVSFRWRKPGTSAQSGMDRGNSVHRAMQYLDFSVCRDVQSVSSELDRLVREEILSTEERDSVDPVCIAGFFQSSLGARLQNAGMVLREFKFSILEPGERFGADLAGEEILLQGVVDLAFMEPDGMVVVDFKTDRVRDLRQKTERYAGQVRTYARAMERIYQMPVKETYLYFFSTGDCVPVN